MKSSTMKDLKILHIHTLPIVSGSGINTFLTMKGSKDAEAKVGLACAPGGRLHDLVEESEMDFYPIRNFVSELAPLKDIHALIQMIWLLYRKHFDIVHTHNSKAGFIGRLAARFTGVPIIVHTVHGFPFHDAEKKTHRALFILLEKWAARWCDRMIAISQPMIDWANEEGIVYNILPYITLR